MVIGWLQVAGACLIVGTIVPGLANGRPHAGPGGPGGRRGELLGSGLGESSDELPRGRETLGRSGLSLAITGLWFVRS